MMIAVEPLETMTKIRHGFFTRQGGVSQGLYHSLNCGPGSNDDPNAVRDNRARAAQTLGAAPEALLTVHQVHGTKVETVTKIRPHSDAPQADALVTDRPGLALGILTADCIPVLFADPERPIIGAAHAGWKGALGGILEATLTAMTQLGAAPHRIIAAIGPAISQQAYEVDAAFRDRFLHDDAETGQWFKPASRPDHFLFDLPAYAAARLARAGIGHIAALDICTYRNEDRFYSFRRATHRREPDYGRQLSAIMVRD